MFLLDIALVSYALQSRPAPQSGAFVAPSFAPIDTPTPSPPAAPPPATVAPSRLIAALNGSIAWRVETSACPSPAVAQLTNDAGGSWTSADVSTNSGVGSVLGIGVESDDTVNMIGLAVDACAPSVARSTNAGGSFRAAPQLLGSSWYVNPADRSTVIAPSGPHPGPCTVLVPAARDAASAAVLCEDGAVSQTTDGGTTWSTPVAVVGAMNIVTTPTGYLVAALVPADCAGVLIVDVASVTPTGCFPTAVAPEELAGRVAMHFADGVIWLWVGDQLARSGDGGLTWQ